MPRTTDITELDVQRQNIDMVAIKQTKIVSIAIKLKLFHLEFFYSYKMAGYKLS